MTDMARLSTTPAGITLCALDDVADRAARNFVIEMRAGRFHGFVVRRGAAVFGYADKCPHMGLPLAQLLDGYLTPDGAHIACSWHGAIFGVDNGGCLGGPCAGHGLTRWPVQVRNGFIVTSGQDAPPVGKTERTTP